MTEEIWTLCPKLWPFLRAGTCAICLIISNSYATSAAYLYCSKTQQDHSFLSSFCFFPPPPFLFSFYGPEIGREAWTFPWDLLSISVLFIWLHSNSPSSCGQPTGITCSLETEVIISSSTICTLGSQLILCSLNNPFSTLLLLLRCCLQHIHAHSFSFIPAVWQSWAQLHVLIHFFAQSPPCFSHFMVYELCTFLFLPSSFFSLSSPFNLYFTPFVTWKKKVPTVLRGFFPVIICHTVSVAPSSSQKPQMLFLLKAIV